MQSVTEIHEYSFQIAFILRAICLDEWIVSNDRHIYVGRVRFESCAKVAYTGIKIVKIDFNPE